MREWRTVERALDPEPRLRANTPARHLARRNDMVKAFEKLAAQKGDRQIFLP